MPNDFLPPIPDPHGNFVARPKPQGLKRVALFLAALATAVLTSLGPGVLFGEHQLGLMHLLFYFWLASLAVTAALMVVLVVRFRSLPRRVKIFIGLWCGGYVLGDMLSTALVWFVLPKAIAENFYGN